MQEARAGRGAARAAGPAASSSRLVAPVPPPIAWRITRVMRQGGEEEKEPGFESGRRPPVHTRATKGSGGRGRSRTTSSSTPPPKTGDEIGGYTPADYITYSADPRHALRHAVEVQCEAPLGVCVELWSEWSGLVEFLDLIGKVGLDPDLPDMALLYCYYRWGEFLSIRWGRAPPSSRREATRRCPSRFLPPTSAQKPHTQPQPQTPPIHRP